MPPKKRNSGTQKELKPGAEGGSPDKKESPELSVKKHKDKDAEFVTLCKNLHVTDLVCDRAWTLWKTVQESMDEVTEGQKKLWGACLFVTMTDLDVPCFTLTQVLKAVNMNVKQFLSLVRKLDVNLDTISTKVNSALTRVEKKYDVMLALYQRFEKICKKTFSLDIDGKDREIVRSCWTMFLLAKGNALQMEDDLVISFQLLLCAVEFFIKRCPPDLLQPLYSFPSESAISKVQSPPTRTSRRNQSKAKSRPPEPQVDLQLLETLCKENECNTEEVKNVYQTSFLAFLDSLDLSRSTDLPQVNSLNQQYNEHYLKSRDIDDRLFLDGDETILPPKIEITQVERTPKKNLQEEDSVIIPPQTPIKAAMASIQQLRGDLVSSGDQPSTTLATYFKNCTIDPTQGMLKRLEMLGQTFSQRFSQAVGPRFIIIGKQRFTLGVRLYYKVMEEMLKSEEKRLSVQNFSKLLNDSTFHTSLLACALEVVMATYGESSFKAGGYNQANGSETAETDLCFPWILDVFSLAAFDFYKVIESFIKAEPTLSKDIVKHLETCENLIMEKIAWRTGSVLFELLKQEHEGGAAEQAEAPASFNQPLQHNHTAADLYLSPMHPGLRVLPPESPAPPNSQHASQPQNQPALQPGGQTPRHLKSNSLSLFYKKLYRLAYTRLKLLCSYLLSFNPELEPIIWTLFQHTLQHEYELMKNRHLDQLMMSAMYAICKVKSVDLRFKTIVTAYKNMPNTNQETFKHVLISDGHYDSIIVFYNQVFMQRLKTNILQYASPRPPTLSPIPQIPRSPYKFPNSPLRVPGSNNVYISPLKSPRMSPGIMTPRSRMLVSIGESFGLSNRFQKINQMVNSSDRSFKRTLDLGPTPKPLKRLRFDVDGQDEADGSKSGGDSTLIQKLAEMSSTRSRMQEQKMKEDAESRRE
ncbi:retinoblastoma-associated protein isoform X3 [Sphaeramia orbicularis]|uniref:retinoblastoma-associated protein isoform X3 n=1 Tax=Sphaeramia orbicularis TaxID=375764 RepID=UPI0011805E62|nr:retinoblastoma-associated protein isoform X3 [Sphaeramia orbicularis]